MKITIQLVLLAFLVSACSKSKTGFVDTQKLFEEYTELTEVQDKYTKMSDEVRSDLEPQIQAFQIKVDLYQKNAQSMSPAERQQKEQELGVLQQQIQQAQQVRGGQIQQESQAEIDTIIKKVRDFIADYGKRNEYEYIYGKNEGANILYGKEELDLTEEILKELNDNYAGGSTSTTTEETKTEADVDTTSVE